MRNAQLAALLGAVLGACSTQTTNGRTDEQHERPSSQVTISPSSDALTRNDESAVSGRSLETQP